MSGYTIVTGAASNSSSVVTCPAGKKVVGGGGSAAGGQVSGSYPSSQTTWTATNGGLGTVTAYAICANVL